MISKAVNLVARKLAGMDSETVSHLSQILSEEALAISDELRNSGQPVDSDILAARLEGIALRMKYEFLNQGHDPSPHEFPIFNVSHNPDAPYPNPINHLYDKRYKEAYSTFIKQSLPAPSTSKTSEPSTPTSPVSALPAKPTTNSQSASNAVYQQGQYQRQLSQQARQPAYAPPASPQASTGGWQYMNPYATMPRSHAAYYQQQQQQQQPSNVMQPTQQQSYDKFTPSIRRSSTADDLRPRSLSRSASSNDLNYATDTGNEKIRVRVVNDNDALLSSDPYKNSFSNNHYNTKRSILKSTNDDNSKEVITTRRIYTAPSTEIGTETMEDLFKVAKKQQSNPAEIASQPMTERIIIIDRRGANTAENDANLSGQDRVRTFEIRTSTNDIVPSAAPVIPIPTPTPTPTATIPSSAYAVQPPNYYPGQQLYYQQPNAYMSVPTNMYSNTTPYVHRPNSYYPYAYYRY
ncbi:unnamed protein product [Rotaria socialis]|uniref:Uncharacterized protein n=1 Tax=Rotaria socialis TaxID=392032 RepID=A0A821ARP9_9BILA|nr:unnamed protein product [Rotaria socialis]